MSIRNTLPNPRVSVHTLGCKLNYAESASIMSDFVSNGYITVPFGQPADFVVINTCTVTDNADSECLKLVRRSKRISPHAVIAVIGCYAQLNNQGLSETTEVDIVLGNSDKMNIRSKMEAYCSGDANQTIMPGSRPTQFQAAASSRAVGRSRSYLKLQDGCDYSCSYCIIPQARGPARAFAFHALRDELNRLADSGYAEVILTGVNLGEYSDGSGHKLMDVLTLIDAMALPFRVRISSLEPNTITHELVSLIAESNSFCRHFHVPLQSGSFEILRRMQRRYNPDMYSDVIQMIHSIIPDAALGIDVISGFPGESDLHFQQTLDLLNSLPYTYIHPFTYSERKGTQAALLPQVVPTSVRRARTRALRHLSVLRRSSFDRMHLNSVQEWVGESEPDESGQVGGWTDNYVRVNITNGELYNKGRQRVFIEDYKEDTGSTGYITTEGIL